MDSAQPTFSLTIGSLKATSERPAAGPTRIVVERDMDVPADGLRLHLSDRSDVALDDAVALELGYGGRESTAFAGTVARLRPAMDGVEVWALGGLDPLLDLRCSSTYAQQSAGDIARDLIARAGLSEGTVDDGPKLPGFAVDARSNGYAGLAALALRLGYELYADVEGKAMFHALGAAAGLDSPGGAPAAAATASSSPDYRYGSSLLGLTATQAPVVWGTVAVGGESPMSGRGDNTVAWLTTKDADFRGSAGSGDRHLLVVDPAARTKDLADRFAAGRLAAAGRRAREVWVTVLGDADVDLGDQRSVSDHPDPLAGGSGYVRALRHRLEDGVGFVTDMRIALGPER
ncbi:MAG: hypothetical protein LC720_04340 [Actinobacteria bacterium]|nr:hypothetical protein [Actinomycetota bacterium]